MKGYILGVVIGLVILSVGGWVPFLIFFLGAALFWYWTLNRGLRIIRAYMYLNHLELGMSPDEANLAANRIDSYGAIQFVPGAKSRINREYGGVRIAMLSDARLRGFAD